MKGFFAKKNTEPKKILKELSKYCDVIEVGIPFNTSTSDSSIIMSANDRAIKSGVKTSKIFKLIKEVKSEIKNNIPFIIMGYLNPIYIYSIKKFAKKCKASNVDGLIIVDSNNNSPEDKELSKELKKIDIAYVKLVAPTNDETFIIPDNIAPPSDVLLMRAITQSLDMLSRDLVHKVFPLPSILISDDS